MMLKLLHITATHLDLAGGVPVVLRELVNEQNKIEDFEARVLSIKADVDNMNSDFFDYLGERSFKDYIEKNNPDIVIFHSHYYFEYLKLYRVLVKKQIPYFIEPHGSFGHAALNKSKYKKIIANHLVLRRYMHYAYGYIFLNDSEKNDSVFNKKNELIIPNGINCADTIEEIRESKSDSVKFYFIGRYDINHKGLDVLIDALRILDNRKESVCVDFYGKGDHAQTIWLDGEISKLKYVKAKNNGPIYALEKREKLEQCGIMLLTSRYEGFPMTVLEAFKYGNPCLVTPGTNVADEIASVGVGWKAEFDSERIAYAIEQAIKDYQQNEFEYKRKSKEYVTRMYSWNTIAEKSFEIFLKVCKTK